MSLSYVFNPFTSNFDAVITPPPASKCFYVDGNRTDSYIQDGTVISPFKTIMGAVNQIIANGDNATYHYSVIVYAGNYSETISLNNALLYNVIFIGQGDEEGESTTVVGASLIAVNSTSNNTNLTSLIFQNFYFLGDILLSGDINNTNFGTTSVNFDNCNIAANTQISVSNLNNIIFGGCGLSTAPTFHNVALAAIHDGDGVQGGTLALTTAAGNQPSQFSGGTFVIIEASVFACDITVDALSSLQSRIGSRVGTSGGSITINGDYESYGCSIRSNIIINSGGSFEDHGNFLLGTMTNSGTLTASAKLNLIGLDMHSNKITGVASGTTAGDALQWGQTGNLTDVGTDGITITGGTNAIIGAGTSISQHVADATHNGYLSSTDWNTFNSKFNLPALTSGSILFSDGTTIAQNNAQFFWDNSTARLFIGNNASIGGSNAGIQYSDATTANRGQIKLHSYFNGTSIAGVSTLTSRSGSVGVNAAVVAGQDYSKWTAQAGATTPGSAPISGTFAFKANTVNSLTVASDYHIALTNLAGTLGDRLYLSSEGLLQLPGYSTGYATFDASGNITSSSTIPAGSIPLTTNHILVGSAGVATDVAMSGDTAIVSGGTVTIQPNVVDNTKLAQAPANTIKGNNTGSTANVLDLTVSQVNTMLGDILANGTVAFTADQSMGSHKLTNVTDPSAAQDAATKSYVDASIAALNPAAACYAATTANISGTYFNGVSGVGATFTTTATGVFSVDGVTPPLNSRILIKNQTSGFQNGIYNLTTAGSIGVSAIFTRSLDYNTASDMNSAGLIPIINGTVNALSSWQQVATITTVGTDSLVFTEFTANPSLYLLKSNNLSDVASASASFNNISPITTTGDIIYASGASTAARLPIGSSGNVLTVSGGVPTWAPPATSGTVTSVSVVSANGLAGTVATATTTPAITLSTTITGILKGNGTAISAAAAGTDYQAPISLAAVGSSPSANGATFTSNTLTLQPFDSTHPGVVTASGGGTSNFLRADGTWAAPAGIGTVTSVAMTVPAFLSVSGSPVTSSGTLAVSLSGTALPIANGGTGQTTNAAAFDALSPLTTKGDLISYSTTNARLGVGADGTVLTADSAQTLGVKWAAPGALVIVSKTANYTLLSTDNVANGDSSGGTFTFTLPSAASNSGKSYQIIKTDTSFNAITITDGTFSTTLNTQNESVTVISNGTAWSVLARTIPSVLTSYTMGTITGTGSNPTRGSGVTISSQWKRIGDSAMITFNYTQTGGGSNGTGTYGFPLPSGMTIDSSKALTTGSSGQQSYGNCEAYNTTDFWVGSMSILDTTHLFMLVSLNSAGSSAVGIGSSAAGLGAANIRYGFTAIVPISGWNG